MTVLLVTQNIGVTAGGARIRELGLLHLMSGAANTQVFDVLAERAEVGCARQCDNCAATMLAEHAPAVRDPYHDVYCERAQRRLAVAVQEMKPAAVVVADLRLHRYLEAVHASGQRNLGIDMHNPEGDLYTAMAAHPSAADCHGPSGNSLPGIRLVEGRACGLADVVSVVSAEDDRRIVERFPKCRTIVVPNAVDVPDSVTPPALDPGPRLIFLGVLDYMPNLVAAHTLLREILPAVRKRFPTAVVDIAGRNPVPSLRAAATATEGARLIPNPAEVAQLFRGAILVTPLDLGGGSRLKILEAFALGCPVISSAKGIEGIEAEDDRHYLKADDAQAYTRAVAEIVTEPAADMRRRQAALQLVRDRYSWAALTALAPDYLARLLGRTSRIPGEDSCRS